MRVLIFGDSITQGFWAIEGGWVERLRKHYDQRQLADLFHNDEPTVFNLGISGDITQGVIKRFKNELDARRWRWPNESFCAVFAIGINDTVTEKDRVWSSPEQFSRDLKVLISIAEPEVDKLMFIGLTPVDESRSNGRPGKPKQYSNERIETFDNVLEKVCKDSKLPYVRLRDVVTSKMNESHQLFDDGLHPNDSGHQLIFELVQPELDKLLASQVIISGRELHN